MTNIEISHLSQSYSNHVKALDDISLTISSGVFGLLGPNGAGKTTLMKTITTILYPTNGSVSVCGFDTRKEGNEVRARIGYLPQELAMYPSLSAMEFIRYMADIKSCYDKSKAISVLEQVGMLEFSKRKIGTLSGGMKRRVGIAQALIGDPQILVVDEPTAGLDPEERLRFRNLLSNYAKNGRTVILSTHIVEDIYKLCEQLAVLKEGNLLFCGTSDDLIKRVVGKPNAASISLEDAYLQCIGGKIDD